MNLGSNKIPWILFEFEKKPRGFFSRQLGLGHYEICLNPTELILPFELLKIICGGHHTIALTISNKLFVWGINSEGQLGLGDRINRNKPHALLLEDKIMSVSCSSHTMALTISGDIYAWGSNNYGQVGLDTDIPLKISLSKIVSVNCGRFHTIAVDIWDNVYAWGNNKYGQLGVGDNEDRDKPYRLKF